MKCWQVGVLAGSFFFFAAVLSGSFSNAQEAPGGNADVIRAQLEKLTATLREIEQKNEQRGKVTEIGSSRGRARDIDEPRLVVKVYDLSDLFTVAPSYPAYEPTELIRTGELQPVFPQVPGGGGGSAAGGFGGGGGGLFAVPNSVDRKQPATLHQASGSSGAAASDVRTSMQSLIDTLTSTIDPDGWADVGGPSTIAPVGSSLLISTTSETHAKLTALIDLFRQRWGSLRTISVQANWLWLSPAQIDEVLVQPKPGEAVAQQQSLNTVIPGEWKKLLAAAADKEGVASGYHSIITCYNGQTVAAQAGSQRIIVTGISPVVAGGQQAAVAYSPITRTIHEGATLQITPLATRHVKYVVLDVHSRVNLLTPNQKPLEKVEKVEKEDSRNPQQVVDALDRTALQTQRLETTLRVPVGQPTLIGGMTFTAAEGKSSHLYLFITAKVQELRDDEPTAAPTTPKVEADEKPKLEKE
jgi:hypothetical protein